MIIFLLLISGIYVGWNIGSNDAANCMGTAVGSGIIKYKKAIWLVAISVLAGSILQGNYVMKALGSTVIKSELPLSAIFIAMLSAGLFVTIATIFHMPVSTSQAIVGGLIGSGIAVFGLYSSPVNYNKLSAIILGWIFGPIFSMIGAIVFHKLVKKGLKKLGNILSGKRIQQILTFSVIFSACYAGYSLGANNAGNAFGPILNRFPNLIQVCMLFGGISLALGVLTFGKRVTKTISKDILPLDQVSAFSAQFSTALVVHIFAFLALPISTSQGIVGSL
ncbi:anion permease, partial [Chlamydiota bacterium]